MLLSAMAVDSSPSRMRSGTIDCMAGPPTTKPKPTKVEPSNTGTAAEKPRSSGSTNIQVATKPEPATHNRRPSRICLPGLPLSAHFPLIGLRISWGPNCTTPTRPTISAEPVASYMTTAAMMLCVHTATTENILPQNSAPKTGSNISANAPRGRVATVLTGNQPLRIVGSGDRAGRRAGRHRRDPSRRRSRRPVRVDGRSPRRGP